MGEKKNVLFVYLRRPPQPGGTTHSFQPSKHNKNQPFVYLRLPPPLRSNHLIVERQQRLLGGHALKTWRQNFDEEMN